MCEDHLDLINLAKFRIDLIEDTVNSDHSTFSHAAPNTREFEKVVIDKMFAQEVTEAVQSGWSAPIVLISMKHGKLRVCVDYRILNEIRKR